MRTIVLLALLLAAQPANAGCFLVFCSPRHHHVLHPHHHRRPRVVLVHKTVVHKIVVKKVIIMRKREVNAPTVDRTPITPLK